MFLKTPVLRSHPHKRITVSFLSVVLGLAFSLTAASEEKNPAAIATPQVPATIPDTADGAALFNTVCAACHGPKGEGNEQIKSPSIAGIPAWYMTTQMANFREGRRGHDIKDALGMLMSAVARMLKPGQIKALSAHIEAMPVVAPKVAAVGPDVDLQNGMMLWQERCMECHRYNASGELAFGSPPLIGRQDWYLAAQIEKFKNGQRGTIKGDVNGAKMVLSSQFIEDEQALKDVIAYIMTLNTDSSLGISDPFAKPAAQKQSDATHTEQASK